MENEKELIQKAKKGNSLAFGKLYDAYRAKGIAIAKQYVKVDQDAEDMYQDAFIKVMGAIERFDESRSFQSWLDVIIVNTCKDFLEKKRAVNFTDMEASSGAEEGEGASFTERIAETDRDLIPEEVLDRKAVREIMEEVLSELPDAQREAVVLYYYREMGVKQIAEAAGVSEDTVKSRLNYARKKTQTLIDAYQKKHDIRLYSTPAASILLFLFFRLSGAERVARSVLGGAAASAGAAAGKGVSAAAGTAETAAATGAGTAEAVSGAANAAVSNVAAATAAGSAASATAVAAGGISAAKIIAGVAAALVIGTGSFFGIRALLTPEPPAEEVIAEIPQDTAEVPPPEPVAEAPDFSTELQAYSTLYEEIEEVSQVISYVETGSAMLSVNNLPMDARREVYMPLAEKIEDYIALLEERDDADRVFFEDHTYYISHSFSPVLTGGAVSYEGGDYPSLNYAYFCLRNIYIILEEEALCANVQDKIRAHFGEYVEYERRTDRGEMCHYEITFAADGTVTVTANQIQREGDDGVIGGDIIRYDRCGQLLERQTFLDADHKLAGIYRGTYDNCRRIRWEYEHRSQDARNNWTAFAEYMCDADGRILTEAGSHTNSDGSGYTVTTTYTYPDAGTVERIATNRDFFTGAEEVVDHARTTFDQFGRVIFNENLKN